MNQTESGYYHNPDSFEQTREDVKLDNLDARPTFREKQRLDPSGSSQKYNVKLY